MIHQFYGFSLVGPAHSETEPSVQLDLESERTNCRQTSALRAARLVIQPFQTVAEDIFILSVGPKRSVNAPPPPHIICALEILLLCCILQFVSLTRGPIYKESCDSLVTVFG